MKNVLSVIVLSVPLMLFGQLPSPTPSVTVMQNVGTAVVSFTYKPIPVTDPPETYAEGNSIWYPGGKGNFFIGISKELMINEIMVAPDTLYAGFQMGRDGRMNLVLVPEAYLELHDEEMRERIKTGDVERMKRKEKMEERGIDEDDMTEDERIEARRAMNKMETNEPLAIPLSQSEGLQGMEAVQKLFIVPEGGSINSANVTLMVGEQQFRINLNIRESEEILSKIKQDLRKAGKKEFKKWFLAARYCAEAGIRDEAALKWISHAEEGYRHWEVFWVKAQLLGLHQSYKQAIDYSSRAQEMLMRSNELSHNEKRIPEEEIQRSVRYWNSRLK